MPLRFCRLALFLSALLCEVVFAQNPVLTSPLPTGVRLDAVGDTVELGSMPLNPKRRGRQQLAPEPHDTTLSAVQARHLHHQRESHLRSGAG